MGWGQVHLTNCRIIGQARPNCGRLGGWGLGKACSPPLTHLANHFLCAPLNQKYLKYRRLRSRKAELGVGGQTRHKHSGDRGGTAAGARQSGRLRLVFPVGVVSREGIAAALRGAPPLPACLSETDAPEKVNEAEMQASLSERCHFRCSPAAPNPYFPLAVGIKEPGMFQYHQEHIGAAICPLSPSFLCLRFVCFYDVISRKLGASSK